MDALSDVLRHVRLSGAVFMDAEFSAPWCIGEPSGVELCIEQMPQAQHVVIYHLVTEGTCEVGVGGLPSRRAQSGDLIVIPSGEQHSLGSEFTRRRGSDVARLVVQRGPHEAAQVRYGGGGPITRLVCGYLACDTALFRTILAPLPRIMIVSMRGGSDAEWLTASIRFSLAESAMQRAGAHTVLAKLSELMFVEALRRYIESLPTEQTGWLAGLRDRFVGRTLALMHAQPAYAWTVDELARRVGLSRSELAERFTHLVGLPPAQYLTHWRLQMAGELLRSGNRGVAAIAAEVGYESEAAFHRAFKREMGTTPAAWRRGLTQVTLSA